MVRWCLCMELVKALVANAAGHGEGCKGVLMPGRRGKWWAKQFERTQTGGAVHKAWCSATLSTAGTGV